MPHVPGEQTPGTIDYDAELRRHNETLRQAVGVRRDDHVLDIGCGTGQTTRQAARAAQSGSAFGVDVSAPAIERARELAHAEGLTNVTFERADAQVHPLPPQRFDVAMSRFGTMFFADPVRAFTNIGRALRPAGRLVMLVWQAHDRNEWAVAVRQALQISNGPVTSEGPDAFSLADPPTVREILRAAGFADIAFTDVQEPVYYGPDVPTALNWVQSFTSTAEALKTLNPTTATDRLRQKLTEHLTAEGVYFNSRAWLITAHHLGPSPA
ncbi:class I SAM-dependent methyltransferase [Actinomadura sp. 9N215]|uniref:class I SAM-dependent methyltransferase n=1 Tax=Actinomadura sp. 9N215 TaxID=3375150 RepID=UPI0037A2E6FD